MFNLPDGSDIDGLRRRISYGPGCNLATATQAQIRWLPESSGYWPLNPCTRRQLLHCRRLLARLRPRFRQTITFNFRCSPSSLVRLELSALPRVRIGLAVNSYSAKLRILTDVSTLHLLTKDSVETQARAIQVTSHARVGVNLLLSLWGAREMRGDFVSFLFKKGTCCGEAWKRLAKAPMMHKSLCEEADGY